MKKHARTEENVQQLILLPTINVPARMDIPASDVKVRLDDFIQII